MDFILNSEELEAMYGLPHLQQLMYLRGIRPYMDVKTGIVGIKRRISLQSLAEQVYIQPHQGIKEESFSRAQVRRALSSLERVGLITSHSKDLQLILKCNLATLGYSVQNKVVTNQSHKAVTNPSHFSLENTELCEVIPTKTDIVVPPKAVTPLKDNNYYIFLYKQFEKFWELYPVKKSQQKSWQLFQALNPSSELITTIFNSLQNQIEFTKTQQTLGVWVPNWKNPDNWLTQRCWEDELSTDAIQEMNHATHPKTTRKSNVTTDMFRPPCDIDEDEDDEGESNVLQFRR